MIFEVIYEYDEEKEIIQQVHYVEAESFKSVANHAIKHAESYEKEVKSIRYIFHVIQRIKDEKTN